MTPHLECYIQIGYPQNRRAVGLLEHMHPEEGHKSDLRDGTPQAESTCAVHPGEEVSRET